jgi:carbon storage regulator
MTTFRGCQELYHGGFSMLVLSRKLGERILVPHCDLAVTIVGIEGSTVRLGITAPSEIGIYREELWRRVAGESAQPEPLAQRASSVPGLMPAPRPEF